MCPASTLGTTSKPSLSPPRSVRETPRGSANDASTGSSETKGSDGSSPDSGETGGLRGEIVPRLHRFDLGSAEHGRVEVLVEDDALQVAADLRQRGFGRLRLALRFDVARGEQPPLADLVVDVDEEVAPLDEHSPGVHRPEASLRTPKLRGAATMLAAPEPPG